MSRPSVSARCTTRATTSSSAVSRAPRTSSVAQRSAASLRAAGSTSPTMRLEVAGAGQHRAVVAVAWLLGHPRHPTTASSARGRRKRVGRLEHVHPGDLQQVDDDRADLGEHHVGGQVGHPLDLGGALADPQQRPLHLAGGPAISPAASSAAIVSAAAARSSHEQHVGPGQRHVVVAGQRHPPDQHPGVAQRAVQRLDELGHPPDVADVPAPERGGRQHRQALVRGGLQLADQPVGAARVGEHLQAPLDVTVARRSGPRPAAAARCVVRRPRPAPADAATARRGTTAAATSATAPPISASSQRVRA